jgi:hypothetical protein
MHTNRDLIDPQGSRTGGKRARADAPPRQKVPPPHSSKAGKDEAPLDPDFAAFARAFDVEHNAKYGGMHGSRVRAEGQATIAGLVAGLTGEAYAWAQPLGLDLDRDDVRRDLCHLLTRIWLTWTGSDDALVQRRHPIGMIVGDLGRLAPEALNAWKRAQRRPAPPPPVETSTAPELDASNPAPKRATAPDVPPTAAFLAFVASMPGASSPAAHPARPLDIVEPQRPDPERLKLALAQIDGAAESAPAESAPAEEAPAESAPAESAPAESAPAESAPAESAPAESAPAESAPAEEAPTRKRRTRTRLALVALLGAAPAEEPLEAPLDDTPDDDAPPSAAHLRRRRMLARIALTYQRRRHGEQGS